MRVHQVAQGTLAWLRLRSGIPTASEFHKILTPGAKLSKQADGYMHSLLAEWIVGHPITGPETDWMTRGHELESDAVKAYEFQTENETQLVGFVTTDNGMIGASPDRLVGERQLLEIKCPKPSTHVGYMLTGSVEDDYQVQLQGQLYVTERDAVDIVSYCPEMPPVVISVPRDEAYIATLDAALWDFVDLMLSKRAELETRYGPFVRAASPKDPGPLGINDADVTALISHHERIGTWADQENNRWQR